MKCIASKQIKLQPSMVVSFWHTVQIKMLAAGDRRLGMGTLRCSGAVRTNKRVSVALLRRSSGRSTSAGAFQTATGSECSALRSLLLLFTVNSHPKLHTAPIQTAQQRPTGGAAEQDGSGSQKVPTQSFKIKGLSENVVKKMDDCTF